MFQENDYITRQIKTMVKGLGKFMGLEQIKEFLQIGNEEESGITDDELETIIATSKIELIIANRGISKEDLAAELNMGIEETKQLLKNKFIPSKGKIDQLNRFINENERYL